MLGGKLVLYRGERGKFQLEARLVSDSVWLTMAQMADICTASTCRPSQSTSRIFMSQVN